MGMTPTGALVAHGHEATRLCRVQRAMQHSILRRQQLKRCHDEAIGVVISIPSHARLTNRVAEAVVCMGIAVIIDAGTIHVVRLAINPNCKIAPVARHAEHALAA